MATVPCFRCHQPSRFYASHLCDLCVARKDALLGISMVEVSIWYSFWMKELIKRAFRPGDARKDIHYTYTRATAAPLLVARRLAAAYFNPL